MGRLTTHVLDAAHGCPGSDIKVELYRVEGAQLELINSVTTNHDGRCDAPVLQGDDYRTGVYQLHFHAGDYYRARGVKLPDTAFSMSYSALRHRCRSGALPRAATDFSLQLLHLPR